MGVVEIDINRMNPAWLLTCFDPRTSFCCGGCGWTSVEVDWWLGPKENVALLMRFGTSLNCSNKLTYDSACRKQSCSVLFLGDGLLIADGMWIGINTKSGKKPKARFSAWYYDFAIFHNFMMMPVHALHACLVFWDHAKLSPDRFVRCVTFRHIWSIIQRIWFSVSTVICSM